MAQISDTTAQTQNIILDIKDGDSPRPRVFISFVQKVFAEFVGTFCLIFVGCAAIVVNDTHDKVVTLPGIALAWGLTVMVMTYAVGHISGAHFNPAVTIGLASSRKFPLKEVPGYIAAQTLASTLAVESLRLVFHLTNNVCSFKGDVYVGTHPSGSNTAAFVVEFIATFNLLFVVSAIATDKRANKSFAGVAIGATVVLDALFSAPISGASMNPARSLAPAYIWGCYKNLWIYIVAPIVGGLTGAWTYNMLRSTKKSCGEILRPNCSKEASQDDSCVLRVVDPNNRKLFILSSPIDINDTCNVTCKLA